LEIGKLWDLGEGNSGWAHLSFKSCRNLCGRSGLYPNQLPRCAICFLALDYCMYLYFMSVVCAGKASGLGGYSVGYRWKSG